MIIITLAAITAARVRMKTLSRLRQCIKQHPSEQQPAINGHGLIKIELLSTDELPSISIMLLLFVAFPSAHCVHKCREKRPTLKRMKIAKRKKVNFNCRISVLLKLRGATE